MIFQLVVCYSIHHRPCNYVKMLMMMWLEMLAASKTTRTTSTDKQWMDDESDKGKPNEIIIQKAKCNIFHALFSLTERENKKKKSTEGKKPKEKIVVWCVTDAIRATAQNEIALFIVWTCISFGAFCYRSNCNYFSCAPFVPLISFRHWDLFMFWLATRFENDRSAIKSCIRFVWFRIRFLMKCMSSRGVCNAYSKQTWTIVRNVINKSTARRHCGRIISH